MKNLLLILAFAALVSCKKEELPAVETAQPTEVHFNFQTANADRKRVECYLWQSNQQGEKLELIAKTDTVFAANEGTVTLLQNKAPYIYAIVTMRVTMMDAPDFLKLNISYGPGYRSLMSRYGTCVVSAYDFTDEYIKIYVQPNNTDL